MFPVEITRAIVDVNNQEQIGTSRYDLRVQIGACIFHAEAVSENRSARALSFSKRKQRCGTRDLGFHGAGTDRA